MESELGLGCRGFGKAELRFYHCRAHSSGTPQRRGLQDPPVLEHFPSSAQCGRVEEAGSTGEEEHTASDRPALASGPQSARS